MPQLVSEGEWLPVGIEDLEPNAEEVVRSHASRLVVAGPGSGKTELLAQRANLLLETGRCPAPKRILAISFKRDAAKNLEDRVQERCGAKAARFDSLTLDAFAKQLVDRFLPALPSAWRPKDKYEVRTKAIAADDIRTWLGSAPVPDEVQRPDVERIEKERLRQVFDQVMHGAELPYVNAHPLQRAWGVHWWEEQLGKGEGEPSLTFPMLNRLAAHLLRCNRKILTALRVTYSHVFLDEFQDTTASQWDLIRTGFKDSESILTAVGDGKQRIMVWAGALSDIFEQFEADFSPVRVGLVRNYRSVPELVRIQHVIAQAVEASAEEQVASSARSTPGICSVLEFRTPEQEAAYLADLIAEEIATGKATPRDFCVLVRQRAADMSSLLRAALQERGFVLRDESVLQDLRVEPVARIALRSLALATRERDATAWTTLLEELGLLSALDENEDAAELEQLAATHKECAAEAVAANDLAGLPRRLVDLVGLDCYRSKYRQYAKGSYLETVIGDLGEVFQATLEEVGAAESVVDGITGTDVVPAMTIHKSKGLEFSTVVFLGLEDGQWWAFRAQPDEEKRAFFVAFSRGIERVLFTFSDQRDTRWGRQRQRHEEVDALHDILRQAGVETMDLRGWSAP